MDITKWKSVAIRTDIVELAEKIAKKTERPKSYVFAFAVKKLWEEVKEKFFLAHPMSTRTCLKKQLRQDGFTLPEKKDFLQ